MSDATPTSNDRTQWFIVLYEWQGAHDMTDDRTWYPSAQIYGGEPTEAIAMLRKGEKPRRGELVYRNIRGPFPWSEPLAVETSNNAEVVSNDTPNMPKRERPQKAPNKSGKQYVDELARYCGLQSGWLDIAPSFQLEYILEQWANAKDDVLRLHHAYMDIKLKELAVKAEPLQGPYCPDTNQPCDRMCQSICNRRECAHEFLPTAGQALSETDPRCIKCHRRWSSVNGRP